MNKKQSLKLLKDEKREARFVRRLIHNRPHQARKRMGKRIFEQRYTEFLIEKYLGSRRKNRLDEDHETSTAV